MDLACAFRSNNTSLFQKHADFQQVGNRLGVGNNTGGNRPATIELVNAGRGCQDIKLTHGLGTISPEGPGKRAGGFEFFYQQRNFVFFIECSVICPWIYCFKQFGHTGFMGVRALTKIETGEVKTKTVDRAA